MSRDEDERSFDRKFSEERRRMLARERKLLPRKVKDNVFSDLFRSKRRLLALYRALHPEDVSATTKDLRNVTCRNVLANGLYNDLGFYVRDSLIILVEAQSTWSSAIVVRMFMYLAATFRQAPIYKEKIVPCIYGNDVSGFPDAELYVIYTGKRQEWMTDTISWRKDVAPGRNTTWDFSVKVLYDGKPGDIISDYVFFCKAIDAQRKLTGYTLETVTKVIDQCLERGVLVDYLKKKEPEVMLELLTAENEQKLIFTGLLEYREKRGEERGKREEKISFARKMLASGDESIEKIVRYTGLTNEEVNALASGKEIQ